MFFFLIIHQITDEIKFESEPIYTSYSNAIVAGNTYMYENFKYTPPYDQEYRLVVMEQLNRIKLEINETFPLTIKL